MFNRIDLNKIHPGFLHRCRHLVASCAARGYIFYAISGYRDEKEQQRLYDIGRKTSGNVVTNAKPFESYHNFGLAIDFCRDKDVKKEGLQPDWEMEAYKVLQEEAHKQGLTSGLDFKSFPEGPHIQLNISVSLTELKAAFQKGGLEQVWTCVN